VKIVITATHFHSVGVARAGPWNTRVNKGKGKDRLSLSPAPPNLQRLATRRWNREVEPAHLSPGTPATVSHADVGSTGTPQAGPVPPRGPATIKAEARLGPRPASFTYYPQSVSGYRTAATGLSLGDVPPEDAPPSSPCGTLPTHRARCAASCPYLSRPPRPTAPHIRAEWLEETVWADVRRFLENPGDVLEQVKEQLSSEEEAGELEAWRNDLGRRLAEKRSEKDRYVKLYARGSLSEEELDLYLTDLKNATDNLKLLLAVADADLAERRERTLAAESVEAWLLALRERVVEVEGDSEEAYQARHQQVRLLVAGITVGRDPDGRADIRITYRFGLSSEAIGAGVGFVSTGKNGKP
jgi:hypothetical protein